MDLALNNLQRLICHKTQKFKPNKTICVETIAILVCKQIRSNSFKNEITYKLFTYKSYMYMHLNVCK